jgi:hypothetical protein
MKEANRFYAVLVDIMGFAAAIDAMTASHTSTHSDIAPRSSSDSRVWPEDAKSLIETV